MIGRFMLAMGYDAATGLLLRGGKWPHIPDNPSPDELRAAAAVWKPFEEFPFVDDVARGVMLAAILTAVVRQTLPLAPGFSFDAPAAGSGKTLLAQCLLVLCGATAAAVIPECQDDEENRKRLLAALREGRQGILFDNIRGQYGSSAIEALLTTSVYEDRVLGASQMLALPTTSLILFSGNNLRLRGDLYRRILTSRIDAKTDAPERRTFALNPLVYCQNHRQELVAAALTLLRGFVTVVSPRATPDKMGSFEAWDDRVRQAVLWIGQQGIMPEGASVDDPLKAMEAAKADEPERQKLGALLSAVHAAFGNEKWRSADLISTAQQMDVVHGACGAAMT